MAKCKICGTELKNGKCPNRGNHPKTMSGTGAKQASRKKHDTDSEEEP